MRRLAIVAGAILAVLAAAWTGAWFYVAEEVRAGFRAWVQEQQASGARIEYRNFVVQGFPLGWTVLAEGMAIAQAREARLAWSGERVRATVRPWSFRTVHIRPEGEHRLAAGTGADLQAAAFTAGAPDIWVTFGPDRRIERFVAEIGELSLRSPPDAAPLRAARFAATLTVNRPAAAGAGAPLVTVSVAIADLLPPTTLHTALPPPIQRFELVGTLNGAWPGGAPREAVARWRDAGGTIEIARIALTWASLDLEGEGTLALDAQNRPLGAGTARVRGHNETLDALAAARMIGGIQAVGLKLALSPFARPASDGRPQITVPITAQNGWLSVANLQLLPLLALRL